MCSNPQGLTGLGGLLRWCIVKMEQKSISTATPFLSLLDKDGSCEG